MSIHKIIREISAQKKCPKDRDMKRVILGLKNKNSAIVDKVIMHLGICEKCQQRANEIGSAQKF